MGKRKPKRALPPVKLTIREGPLTPAQAALWSALWRRLLLIESAPASSGKQDRGRDVGGEEGGKQPPPPG